MKGVGSLLNSLGGQPPPHSRLGEGCGGLGLTSCCRRGVGFLTSLIWIFLPLRSGPPCK